MYGGYILIFYIYQKSIRMLLFSLSCLFLVVLMRGQPSLLEYTVAIQTQNETYFSYLPFYETCNYAVENMIPEDLIYSKLDQETIYSRIIQNNMILFWGPVKNGLDIAFALNEQGTSPLYMGYILYDSEYINFTRPIICFNYNQSELIFSSIIVTINTSTLQLSFKQQNSSVVNLSQDASQILGNCSQFNQSNFAYLGNQAFLFVCAELAQGFIFYPFSNSTQPIIESFSQIGKKQNYMLATNPVLMDRKKTLDQFWSCVLMFQKEISFQFSFIFYENQSITIISQENATNQLYLLVGRIWGLEDSVQFIRLIDLYSYLNISQENLFFPGNVTTILITEEQNIYVESKTQEFTYLFVFNGYGELYWNTSLRGTIIYFGNQIFIVQIQNQMELYLLQLFRPIYTINSSRFQNQSVTVNSISTLQLNLQCTSGNMTIIYNILWTSYQYPTIFIEQIPEETIYTYDSTYAVQVQQRYLIIGPDIHVIPSPPLGMNIFVINSRQVNLSIKTVALFKVDRYLNNTKGILVVTEVNILVVTPQGKIFTLINQPCGFNEITSAQIPTFGQFILTNYSGQVCTCIQNICSQTNNLIYQNQETNKQNQILNQNKLQGGVLIKTILYQMIQSYVVVVIFQNNNVILYDYKVKKILSILQFACPAENETNGIIFTSKFSQNSLLLYCQGASEIFQYFIGGSKLFYQRTIPLYKFKTTLNQNGIKQSSAFIYLEVRPLSPTDTYPMLQNCCILRIDPELFTVSAIIEIIYADYLIQTATYENYEFVIMENITQNAQLTVIKIYIANQWLIFNQTNNTVPYQQYVNISMYFRSQFYNLYSFGFINITFNLTSAQLSSTHKKKNTFDVSYIKTQKNFFYYNLAYNLSEIICGPIFYSYFKAQQGFEEFVRIKQYLPLLQSKLIGNGTTIYIQLINPANWRQTLTFNNLILCVTSQKMFVFAKNDSFVQMVPMYNFSLPQKFCTYHLYNITGDNSVSLISDCYGINNNYETPIINMTFINNQKRQPIFNYSISYISIPLSLKNIQTIIINNFQSYVVGKVEGPVQLNGKLVICGGSNCTVFYTSNLQALIDYSLYEIKTSIFYVVLVLGNSVINIYKNPTPLDNNLSQINPNFSIPFNEYINQAICSTILTIYATQSFAEVILSCSLFYYYVNITYTTNQIQIINKFSRYSQCNLFDEFKPQILYENKTLLMFFTQCRKNQFKTSLDIYVEAQRNSSEGIFTGYLQIFTIAGPRGPNCSKDSISPIQITQISTSMNFPVFLTYTITMPNQPTTIFKFIYEPMNGFLVDNYIQFEPNVTLEFNPADTNHEFPQIVFVAFNQFYSSSQTLTIGNKNKIEQPIKKVPAIISIVVFCILNIITIVFGICYPFYLKEQRLRVEAEKKKKKKADLKFEEQNISDFSPSERYSITQNRSMMSIQSHISTESRPFQIELHFVKTLDSRSMKTE